MTDEERRKTKPYDGTGAVSVDEIHDFVAFAQTLHPDDRKMAVEDLQDRLCLTCGAELPKWGPCPECKAIRPDERHDPADVERRLMNLLAIVHRDGGHHTAWVGLEKSVEDAVQVVAGLHHKEGPDMSNPVGEAVSIVTQDFIPRKTLIAKAEKWLAGIRERPQMYGGVWHGVEIAIIDALAEREFALAWPHEPPGDIGCRWCMAVSRTHRETNGTMIDALTYDGITDRDAITAKYQAAIDEFLSCDGLYPYWLKHGQCGGCKGVIHGKNELPHCTGECGTYPCDHADGKAEAERWKAVFARGR